MRWMDIGIAACTLIFLATATHIVRAETIHHETRFSIRFGGIEVGKAVFDITFDDVRYELKGRGKTTGLVEWLAPTTGNFASKGSLREVEVQPQLHSVSVKERKKAEERVSLAFANDEISEIKIVSEKKHERVAPKYVPLETSHMTSVMDPVSTLIIPMKGQDAKNGSKVCNHRFPVFDGETRYDIELNYKTTSPVSTMGYDGYAYVCNMRYIPVAGHRKNHRTVKEMASNKNMDIWLAPMSGLSVFTPIQIRVGTKYGRFVATPEYFGPKTDLTLEQ